MLRGRIFGKGSDRLEIARLDNIGATRANFRDGLNGKHRVHYRAALAAIGFVDCDAHQALPCHQFRHIEREILLMRTNERTLPKMALCETTNGLLEDALLFTQVEIQNFLL